MEYKPEPDSASPQPSASTSASPQPPPLVSKTKSIEDRIRRQQDAKFRRIMRKAERMESAKQKSKMIARTGINKIKHKPSLPEKITAEQLAKAGYRTPPANHQAPPPGISIKLLRDDLKRQAVPITFSMLKSNHFSDADIYIPAPDGSNMLDYSNDQTIRALERRVQYLEVGNENKMIEDKPNSALQRILNTDLCRANNITKSDFIVTEDNQDSIRILLGKNKFGMKMVKPWSVSAGILGFGSIGERKVIVGIGNPTEYGQPGPLFAIYDKDAFSCAKPMQYNPNDVFDVPPPPSPPTLTPPPLFEEPVEPIDMPRIQDIIGDNDGGEEEEEGNDGNDGSDDGNNDATSAVGEEENWARSHYTEGAELIDTVLDTIREENNEVRVSCCTRIARWFGFIRR